MISSETYVEILKIAFENRQDPGEAFGLAREMIDFIEDEMRRPRVKRRG